MSAKTIPLLRVYGAPTKSVVKQGHEFITDSQATAAVIAYFGEKGLEANPNLLYNLRPQLI